MSELPKTTDPKSVEDKLYKFWVDSGFFHAEVNPDRNRTPSLFRLRMLPASCTWATHSTRPCRISSSRTKRMQGYEALWMPGTDHAGIATLIKVEENLRKEGGPDPLRPRP